MSDPLLLFYSYTHADEEYRIRLDKHLKLLERKGIIQPWSDRKIMPGDNWKPEIDDNLNRADIILLLVSADFIASDYCFDIEMTRALERHQKGEARVIPIILKPVDWKQASFASVQALPHSGKPVSTWANQEEAWEDVAKGIRRIADQIRRRDAAPEGPTGPRMLEEQADPGDAGAAPLWRRRAPWLVAALLLLLALVLGSRVHRADTTARLPEPAARIDPDARGEPDPRPSQSPKGPAQPARIEIGSDNAIKAGERSQVRAGMSAGTPMPEVTGKGPVEVKIGSGNIIEAGPGSQVETGVFSPRRPRRKSP